MRNFNQWCFEIAITQRTESKCSNECCSGRRNTGKRSKSSFDAERGKENICYPVMSQVSRMGRLGEKGRYRSSQPFQGRCSHTFQNAK